MAITDELPAIPGAAAESGHSRTSSCSTVKRPPTPGDPWTRTLAPKAGASVPSGRSRAIRAPCSSARTTMRSERPCSKSSAVRISIVPDRISTAARASPGSTAPRNTNAAARRAGRSPNLMNSSGCRRNYEASGRPIHRPFGQGREGFRRSSFEASATILAGLDRLSPRGSARSDHRSRRMRSQRAASRPPGSRREDSRRIDRTGTQCQRPSTRYHPRWVCRHWGATHVVCGCGGSIQTPGDQT